MNPNPRDRPVSRSLPQVKEKGVRVFHEVEEEDTDVITTASVTLPNWENAVRSESVVVSLFWILEVGERWSQRSVAKKFLGRERRDEQSKIANVEF